MGKGWKQSGVLPEREEISRNDVVLIKWTVPPASEGAKKEIRGFDAIQGRKASKKAIFG